MNRTKVLFLIGVIFLVIFAGLSLFVINETERAIILRLGKVVNDSATKVPEVLGPGMHAKVPLIEKVRKLDWRIQSLEINASRIPTEEKKELIVDLFTKWRIQDAAKFYTATGGEQKRAEQLLKEKMIDGLRGEFGRRKLNDVVSQDRQSVMNKIRHDANNTAKTLGVEVVDARIVRIELPHEVSESTYNLMRTERYKVAQDHRARGRSIAEAIRANADRQVTVIKATAEKEASQTRGEGEAIASQVYAEVYGKDPEFYRFYRSMEAYKETFNKANDMLVIKPDDAFFKYFRSSQGNVSASEKEKS